MKFRNELIETEELQSVKINIIKNIKLLLIISNNLKAQFVSIVAKTT
jgi:hypothetical protein